MSKKKSTIDKKIRIHLMTKIGLAVIFIALIGGLVLYPKFIKPHQGVAQSTTSQEGQPEKIEASLRFLNSTPFATRDKKLYDYIDTIEISYDSSTKIIEYPTINELKDMNVEKIKNAATDTNILVYFGFQECPFCVAFTPKLNWLAKALNVQANFINTHELDLEVSKELQKEYQFKTVPTLIWLQNNKIIKKADHTTSMQELEDMLVEYAQNSVEIINE